jgi:hypothetical protein
VGALALAGMSTMVTVCIPQWIFPFHNSVLAYRMGRVVGAVVLSQAHALARHRHACFSARCSSNAGMPYHSAVRTCTREARITHASGTALSHQASNPTRPTNHEDATAAPNRAPQHPTRRQPDFGPAGGRVGPAEVPAPAAPATHGPIGSATEALASECHGHAAVNTADRDRDSSAGTGHALSDPPGRLLAVLQRRLGLGLNEISLIATVLCAIDCTVLPVLLLGMGALGALTPAEAHHMHALLHGVGLYIAVPIGGLAVATNHLQHRRVGITAAGVAGISLIAAASTPLGYDVLLPQWDTSASIVGCGLLLGSGFASRRALPHSHGHSHGKEHNGGDGGGGHGHAHGP